MVSRGVAEYRRWRRFGTMTPTQCPRCGFPHEPTTRDKLRALLRTNPETKPADAARLFGVSIQRICQLLDALARESQPRGTE
jgi:hypothetical protein